MRLGLLGGSFNPVHNGHLTIARQAREAIGLDQILFIPASYPPHKPNGSLAPAKDRHEMVRLAIASDPSLAISDVEIRRPGKSYSIDTIRLLQQEYGAQTQLYFLIGLDAFLDFLPPIHCRRDTFPINPEIQILTFESFCQLACDFNIPTRV